MQKLLKKLKKQEQSQPRSLPEISKEASEVAARLGQAQYQVYVYNQEVERLSKEFLRLNQEGAARNIADREAKASELAKAGDVKNG